jgi:membrane-associated phospholipid phosphatase
MQDLILDTGILVILYLQSLGDWLIPAMGVFTTLGYEQFYVLFLLLLYWSIDASLGLRLGLLLFFSGAVNHLFKVAFHGPRPYWYDSRVRALSSETTFGVPSGHAQNAVVLWGVIATKVRKRWAWAGAVTLMFFISVSRLYLGVHFPSDVLVGWLLGLFLLAAFIRWEPRLAVWVEQKSRKKQVALAFSGSFLMLAFGSLTRSLLGDWTVPEVWIEGAQLAAPLADPLAPLRFSELVAGAGVFLGLALGAILTHSRGGFSANGSYKKRITRLPLGLTVALLVFCGFNAILPELAPVTAAILLYLHYALVGFWITGLAPLLFIRLNLASRAPKTI